MMMMMMQGKSSFSLACLVFWLSMTAGTVASSSSFLANDGISSSQFQHYQLRGDAATTSTIQESSSSSSTSSSSRRRAVRKYFVEPQVRHRVRKLEESTVRSQTGLPTDPNHIVPYENHPYQRHLDERNLKSSSSSSSSTSTSSSSSSSSSSSKFQPVRIYYETAALDSLRTSANAAQIDFVKSQVLPRAQAFWQQALSVVPVSGNLLVASSELVNRQYCGDSEFTQVPTKYISQGIANYDIVFFVSGTPSATYCSGSTLAVAVSCNYDQFDRPTAGNINFCLNQIQLNSDGTANSHELGQNVDVAIHESAHVFGMSSNSFRFFWDPDTGTPRTSRPFSSRTVTCVNGNSYSLVLPAENTLQFATSSSGQSNAYITTPKVKAVTRNQFNCQSLIGAQLENQPTGTDSCYGDHWDERQFNPEAMTSIISPTRNILSPLTLALMEDSGWYKANYTQSELNPWGLGAGCDFYNAPCLSPSSGTPSLPSYSKGYFCTQTSDRGCFADYKAKFACTLLDYSYILPKAFPPSRFSYFTSNPNQGGPEQMDYCPVYESTYNGLNEIKLDCTDSTSSPSVNVFNEAYGSHSKCIPTKSGEAKCYESYCIKEEMALKINVLGTFYTCKSDFQEINVLVGGGIYPLTLVCPRLSSACPDLFCPFFCAGRGVCNYNNTVNGTIQPACQCFDKNDTSPGCSDSQIPDGGYLSNSAGLINNVRQGFFDPLVAVFVDSPNKWTTASWAWAAGLLVLFLVMFFCICSSFWPESSRKSRRY